MKKFLILIVSLVLATSFLVGCEFAYVEPDAEQKQKQQTKQIINEMNNQIGMPNIKEFYEKKMAKEIFELRDNSKLVTYAYSQNLDGKFVYLGQCIGFGLPYSVQYTNPEKVDFAYKRGASGYDPYTLPQADPNGLYMPDGLSATWLMYINPETGEREIIYTEPSIVVTQSKLPKRLVASWSIQGIDY